MFRQKKLQKIDFFPNFFIKELFIKYKTLKTERDEI